MRAFFNRLAAAFFLLALFVGLTKVVDAVTQRLGRGYGAAVTAFLLGFWLWYSRNGSVFPFGPIAEGGGGCTDHDHQGDL
jgi:hypothetical protein